MPPSGSTIRYTDILTSGLVLVKRHQLMTAIPDRLPQPGTAPTPPPSPAPFRLVPTRLAGPTSVGDAVYEQILEALQQGRLRPGERLNDGEFAAHSSTYAGTGTIRHTW